MAETIFITGVSCGLGHGLAKVYLEQGATVYGCSRRAPEDLIAQGLIFQKIDLADAERGQPELAEWLSGVAQFDAVILNAAKLGEIRDMQATPLSDLRETMEINVWANNGCSIRCLLRTGWCSKWWPSHLGPHCLAVAVGMAIVYPKRR